MQLRERLEQQGAWLFRLRGVLPLLLLPILFVALRESEVLEGLFGSRVQQGWESSCFVLSLLGVAVRVIAVGHSAPGTSGRNTRRQKAETLNTSGVYATVRHPLYLGNFLIFLGVLLLTEVWWFVLIGTLAFWIYYERIILAEESYLRNRFGEQFAAWAAATPVFLPRPSRWTRPARAFDYKLALRRETSTLFATVLIFAVLNVVMDLLVESRLEGARVWAVRVLAAGTLYLLVRFLRKHTRLMG